MQESKEVMNDAEIVSKELEREYTTDKLRTWIAELAKQDAMWKFYKSPAFRRLRAAVLRSQHYECQLCKAHGRIRAADTVHHVKHVRDYPELALSAYYYEQGTKRRQLVAICKICHALEHPEKLKDHKTESLTVERW
ncbi:HNH endonuclease [Anaerobutyricum soehngenii]|nr:HNH endonuclease [Anaerobutyricum soehngenii]